MHFVISPQTFAIYTTFSLTYEDVLEARVDYSGTKMQPR